ncbi:MAG: PQQ-binding-like beta-propeller repeat protein [Verrucomicrobia bacterium]|nr:PQQ-binding-like beta-propeller repeat protein [Verrucomicrobiota bacterium]
MYFTTLARFINGSWTYSQVISLEANGGVRWSWNSDSAGKPGNMRMVPTINSAGTRLYVGTDQGKVFCLDTAASAMNRMIWQYTLPSGQTNCEVRSGIAYDPVAPKAGGGTEEALYFQANDGYTYSLNAVSGTLRWRQNTGNLGGLPTSAVHPTPWSSTPVVGLDGGVYVGSADGRLYRLEPLSGTTVWKVALNQSGLSEGGEPVESAPAIGENGWIYVATRTTTVTFSHLYAIDPNREPANQNNAVEKTAWFSGPLDDLEPGVIAGLALDQSGRVIVPAYHSMLYLFDGASGQFIEGIFTKGKLCQTPALNRNGLVIVGTSRGEGGERSIMAFKVFPQRDGNADWAATYWGGHPNQEFGDFLGGVLIRADGSGTTYLADANPDTDSGAVYKLTSGSPSMPGDWPTLGCGNRRQHKARTYPYQLLELGPFPEGVAESQGAFSVDAMGRVVGYAHGRPGWPYYSLPQEWYGAYWYGSGSPQVLGTYATAIPRQWARNLNLAGIVVGHSTYGSVDGPIVWTSINATPQALPLPSGYTSGEARDISTDNTMVGFSFQGGKPRVLRWDYDPWSGNWYCNEIGAPGGGKAQAYALSGRKRICGKAVFTAGGTWVGFTSRPDESSFALIEPLGAFGGTSSEAWDVHDASGTVGWAHKRIAGTDYQRAFLVPPDVYQLAPSHELPGFIGQTPTGTWRSYAYGVNGCAQVVGSAQNTSGAYRAYLWQPGWANLKDLTSLAPSGWVLTSAAAISDAGHIIGSGTKNGASRQWLMVPTPQE